MLRLAALIACLLALPVAAQDNPIVQRLKAFTVAYNTGDAAAIATFYTKDAAILPPQSAAVVGREAITKHYADAFNGGVRNLRIDIKEIRAHGPSSAVEIGETAVDFNGQTILGRYLHVWVQQDGAWYLSRDIYHVLDVR